MVCCRVLQWLWNLQELLGHPPCDGRCCARAQGKGEGQLQLKLTYFPFELLYSRPRDASLVCLQP